MPTNTPHGTCTVRWNGEVCFAVLNGCFNHEGVFAMTALIQQAWHEAGEPPRWAHVMDLFEWQGGTESGFAASHALLDWAITHGAQAIVRISTNNFLLHVTEHQGVYSGIDVPVVKVRSREDAWDWLAAHGFSSSLREELTDKG